MTHQYFLQTAMHVAKRSMEKGNLPFGCVLTGPENTILLEGENTVVTDANAIAHCEINLVQQLGNRFERDYLQQCTLYATTEPCAMCAAAIYWSGIGKLVYALDKTTFHQLAGTSAPEHILDMRAEEVLNRGRRTVNVIGPLMEKEAGQVYMPWLHDK